MLDRVISAKLLIHRVSVKTSISKFQRIFHLPKKMAAILNFEIFRKNQKSLYLENRFGKIFVTHRVSVKTSLSKSQQIFHLPKNGGHFEFLNFFKNTKHKNACVSKTVPDRAISAKYLTRRVSVRSILSKFQRIFHLPKMAAILNFRIFFFKIAKYKNACISKTVLDRAILTKSLIHRVTLPSS